LQKEPFAMKSAQLALLGLAALPLAFGAYAWGRSREAPAKAVPTITIPAQDFALEAPDTLPEGAVRLRLVNQGKKFHHVWLARLDGGRTLDDVLGALKSHGPMPAWLRDMGGPNAPMPGGGEANATVVLTPGSYLLACLIPSADGVPHLMKGMIRQLTVVETDAPAAAPAGDVTMTLDDYRFTLSRPLAAGRQLIEVRNVGGQSHEVELIKLAPGKNAMDVLAWVEKPVGPPAGFAIGGVSPLARGGVSWFDVVLEPGRYGLLCFLPDAKDGKPHFEHGMANQTKVAS
ncbi:MAG: hypothetical protein ACRDJK_11670, partial [Actinomycetota bacterium]